MDVVNKDIRMVGVSEEDVEQRVVVVTPKGSRQKKKGFVVMTRSYFTLAAHFEYCNSFQQI